MSGGISWHQELEAFMAVRAGGISLEQLRQIIRLSWFPDGLVEGERVPLCEWLVNLARQRLQISGRNVVLTRLDKGWSQDAPLKVSEWRWISLAQPEDLLVAALYAGVGSKVEAEAVCVAQSFPTEEREPLHEVHLHLGAAISFSALWRELMQSVAANALDIERLQKLPPISIMTLNHIGSQGRGGQKSAQQNSDALALVAVLTSAAVIRFYLALFLNRRSGRHLPAFLKSLDLPTHDVTTLGRTFRAVLGGGIDRDVAPLRLVARRLFAFGRIGADHVDPLEGIQLFADSTWVETEFLCASISYALGVGKDDLYFQRAFWQYVRLRGMVFRYVTTPPGVGGLDWFQTSYRRISPLRARVGESLERTTRRRLRTAIALAKSAGDGVGSLEVRDGPSDNPSEVLATYRAVRDTLNSEGVAGGLLFHFVKELRNKDGRLHGDPGRFGYACRFGAYFVDQMARASAICAAYKMAPDCSQVLVGLDVCSLELAVPTWVLLPVVRKVRDELSRGGATPKAIQGRRFGLTWHVGEEFRRLPEGLRRIDELVSFEVLRLNDRLGHALAMMVDIGHWCGKSTAVVQPKEDRLDDLLWEIERSQGLGSGREPVRRAAASLGREIYGERCSVEHLVAARRMRHDFGQLRRLGYPRMNASGGPYEGPLGLLYRYLTDAAVFRRGQAPIRVANLDGEEEMVGDLRKALRNRLTALDITIECNVSSNLIVGAFNSVSEHPLFSNAVEGLGPDEVLQGGLRVALGSDDPITFATSLPSEYAYAEAGIRHCMPSKADRVIRGLRSNARRATFVALQEAIDSHALKDR